MVATDKRQPVQASSNLGLTEGGLVCASVVARHTGLQQQSAPHNPKANGSDHSETIASSLEAKRHMSLEDIFGPLCGMP